MQLRWALTVVVAMLTLSCGTGTESSVGAEAEFVTGEGRTIELVGPSPDGRRLLMWAFSRFETAGLAEPVVDAIHFGDGTVGCERASGWTRPSPDGVELAICLPEDRLCLDGAGTELANLAKFCALHELAHTWMLAHLDPSAERDFLVHAGLDEWHPTADTEWHRRGVEYAAELLAWGLMDTPMTLVRIESPSCEHAAEGFAVLTGEATLIGCPEP